MVGSRYGGGLRGSGGIGSGVVVIQGWWGSRGW